MIDISVRLSLGISREPGDANFPCNVCRHRRVRYRIGVGSFIGAGATDARCLECWVTNRQPSVVSITPVDDEPAEADDAAHDAA